ncbi:MULTISPECIES: lytic transglycosylase domain-containing protein [Sphingomonas]|uniref:lytic transglycosylase domain-containing protein n=1 Tax=Sphingomonas TaxID=13687 RepID=UPI000F7DFE91|nr:lytic transglycosylase domain-containing protein [Sphingomonas sp. ABOLF]RSV12218.1 lytic transglycosylase domain-containing protein [Sphingomonas sp. ABOLF]
MSSMLTPLLSNMLKGGLLAAGVTGASVASDPLQHHAASFLYGQALPVPQQLPGQYPASQQMVQPVVPSDPIAAPLAEWKRLQQSDNLPFTDYARFLLAHPGWPGETSRRAAAETAPGAGDPSITVRFFERFPPLTAAGRLRNAEALMAMGRADAAREAARAAWRSGVLRPSDEARLISVFSSALTPADREARLDRLLWANSTTVAARELPYVSPAKQALFRARLAFRTNASMLGGMVVGADRNDPGFIADRATWLRNSGQSPAARAYLAQPRTLSALPGNVEKWYEVLLANASGAANDRQYAVAFDIARQIDDAYPAGTDVSDKPYGERDDYTSLAWLAGRIALKNLGRPADAVGMFSRYGNGSRTPTTRAKGFYWAARAAEAAGDTATANRWYESAAALSDVYYGQLALERLGRPLRAPSATAAVAPDPATRQAFYGREVVQAVQYLGRTGAYQDQTLFVRQIANAATSDTDHALAAELSKKIGRPDLGVMVGRSALMNGHSDYTVAGYPSVPVPATQQSNFTMIHAIARQESQFDRAAVSHAGARGLMQLMPGTAREAASKLGLSYDSGSLTSDTGYNIQLGSSYFQRMLDYYGGSYPLAVAAYNAGPGNVNKWLGAFGDPRTGAVDTLDWVESIPYTETRNYVQRVLENAVVYDLLNPQHARSRGPANLSWYLGKNRPG